MSFQGSSGMFVNTKLTRPVVDNFLGLKSFNDCQMHCMATPGCFNWSWHVGGNCQLLAAEGVTPVWDADYISGLENDC